MSTDAPVCPECSQPTRSGGLAFSEREDDGQRTCRALWKRVDRHVWWRWADRPDGPWEVCPVPQLFR
ncbi:dehydrogenase [Streptomyces shenzhenensis]|uniref:dehydrogenase n=1 Tax=Streptomyces shenzhenensis TaxID=943815 RepID=UPI00380057AA